MSYLRVLPRDAFNEANLLKCIGKLTLLIEDSMLPGWRYEYDNGPFEICQNESDGSIYVANIEFTKNGERVEVFTPMNSRRPWPLCAFGAEYEGDFLFDDAGKLELTP